jgi:hypothetical protein
MQTSFRHQFLEFVFQDPKRVRHTFATKELSIEQCFKNNMLHSNLLVGHHQLRQEGIPLIVKDVWPNSFFSMINNTQVSISGLTIQRGKPQSLLQFMVCSIGLSNLKNTQK